VIGHESDIKAWTLDDLKRYHKTYYAPNNAVMVVAGDVKLSEVKKLAEQYLEPIPAQPKPEAVRTVEPEQKGERRVYVQKASVTSPNLLLGFHIPASSSPDYYALDLLNSILGEGNSSRLYQGLVDKELAVDVFSYLPMSFDPNLFYLMAVANPGVKAADLETALIGVINKVAKEGVTQAELEKAKNQKLMQFYREMETINGKADIIGTYELYFGSYQKLFDAPKNYQKVTPADIQRVAQSYLKKSNRTVAVLDSAEDKDL
jgi:predicted Zn-dependent peptidase